MRFSTVLFDLDGTLLDTLTDLHASVAHGLRNHGLAVRSVAEVRAFLGNGIRHLIERAVPEGTEAHTLEAVFADFRAHYLALIPACSNSSSDCKRPVSEWALSATNSTRLCKI